MGSSCRPFVEKGWMLVAVSNKSTILGPMQQNPLNIKERLFQGIDRDYNVTNMGIVVEVIGELENFHITREELETTRLGKHINELRRKASDRLLAGRAKSLVKKWRALLSDPAPGLDSSSGPPPGGGNNNNSSLATNGNTAARLGQNVAVSPRLPSTLRPNMSPGVRGPQHLTSPRGRTVKHPPTSPSLQRPGLGTGSRTSPVVVSSTSTSPVSHSVSRPTSPTEVSRDPSPAHRSLNASPEVVAVVRSPVKRPRPRSASEEVEVVDLEEEEERRAKKRPRVELTNGDRKDHKTTNKINSNSDKIKSRDGLVNDNQTRPRNSVKRRMKPVDNTSNILNRQMMMATKAGKVRTTQELVQNLGIESRASSLSPSGGLVTDLVPNENKAELMNRFFSSQRVTNDENESGPPSTADEGTSSEATPSAGPSRVPSPVVGTSEKVEDILAQLPPIDSASVLAEWEAEHGDDEVEEEGLIPVFRPPVEVTQKLIDDLNSGGELEHIGGIRDHQGEFKEWHELVSLVARDGELLHILPYSVID